MKFFVRFTISSIMKATWTMIPVIFLAWKYYSYNDGTRFSGRYNLGPQGSEYRYYVVGLIIVIALVLIYFVLTRHVVLTKDKLLIKTRILGNTINISEITQVQVQDKEIIITYNHDYLIEDICLQLKDDKRFLQEFYAIAPHLK